MDSNYTAHSDLRDYLEEMLLESGGIGEVELTLSTEEVKWVLDQVYWAIRQQDNVKPEEGADPVSDVEEVLG